MKRKSEPITGKSFEHGRLISKKLTDRREFFEFLDELEKDYDKQNNVGLYKNRTWILQTFIEKRLYVLKMRENDSMFTHSAQRDPLFVANTFYVLPCLCIVAKERKDTVEMIWTAKRARRQGFVTALLEELEIQYAVGIVPGSEAFWQDRDIKVVCAVKPSFHLIATWPPLSSYKNDDDDDDEESLDELYDSSEEEGEVLSETLEDTMIHKTWLLGNVIDIKDIEHYIASLLRLVYYEQVEFRPIDPSFWTSIYGIMSTQRIETQQYKSELGQASRMIDHTKYYGQFIKDVDNIVRNKTMMISRPYHLYQDEYKQLELTAAKHHIRMYAEPCRFRNNGNAWCILFMDSGINKEKAIRFARSLDYENDNK